MYKGQELKVSCKREYWATLSVTRADTVRKIISYSSVLYVIHHMNMKLFGRWQELLSIK